MNIYATIRKFASASNKDYSVPGDNLRFEFGPDDGGKPMNVAVTNEFGSSLWIAYNHSGEWRFHTDARYAFRLAWWILWHWWVKATWCGIKTRLYFWALRKELRPLKAQPTPTPATEVK